MRLGRSNGGRPMSRMADLLVMKLVTPLVMKWLTLRRVLSAELLTRGARTMPGMLCRLPWNLLLCESGLIGNILIVVLVRRLSIKRLCRSLALTMNLWDRPRNSEFGPTVVNRPVLNRLVPFEWLLIRSAMMLVMSSRLLRSLY